MRILKMAGQLCWLPKSGTSKLTLHLRFEPYQPWKPYTAYPVVCVPDYLVSGGSNGWATSQQLLQIGWTLIPTKQAQRSFIDDSMVA
jgi:hypothetical protein